MLPIIPPIVVTAPTPIPVPYHPKDPGCNDPNGSSNALHAYMPKVHTFRLVLVDHFEQETLETIQTDRDRYCNVVQAVRQQFPGKSIVDSWEVA